MSEKQYVIFKLDKEEYGIDIMNVKEISQYQEIIKVPNAPSFVEGIINFRGNVIPVISLRKRFNMKESIIGKDSRIIIISIGQKEVGFLVDEASQTIRLDDSDIDPTPDIISGDAREFITGIGKLDNGLLILINLEKVLSEKEKLLINKIELSD